MSKLKVTMKDLDNLRISLDIFETTREVGEEKEIESMKKTFEKVQNVLLEKLKQQDK
jgi:hypothetical protein|tara:strand:- start:24 stop:194 length:171 start_codon:yes stop_codon:yes gene_type:complete